MAFDSCIFFRKPFLLYQVYREIRMDRETEASNAQKKHELLKNAENASGRGIKKNMGLHPSDAVEILLSMLMHELLL